MHAIENEMLAVWIASQGAELQSIVHKHTGLEYMWSGDPAYWAKKSPVLFPIVGGLKNGQYSFRSHTYQLGRHGFARERAFAISSHTDSSICFTLLSDEESKRVYPFDFRFSLTYTLHANRVTVTYEVENTGSEPMYFSVGAHPAFAVPLTAATVFSDYYLLFGERETAGRWPLSAEGLIEKASIPWLSDTRELPLNKALFLSDALVCKALHSESISILNRRNPHGVRLGYTGFPYMGIWSAKQADFVCIEPWCGIADSVDASGELSAKEGINELAAGEIFTRSWYAEVF